MSVMWAGAVSLLLAGIEALHRSTARCACGTKTTRFDATSLASDTPASWPPGATSCRTPIGAFTELTGVSCRLTAEILSPDGCEFYRGSVEGAATDAAKLGTQLGATLLEQAGPEFQRQFKG